MKLLFVVRGVEDYGVERKLIGLMGSLVRRGWTTDLYSIGDGPFAARAREAAPSSLVHIDPNVPTRFTGSGLAKIASMARLMSRAATLKRNLSAFLTTHDYDAVVLCEHGLVVPVGAAARTRRTPVFWLMPNLVSGNYPADLNRRIYAAAFDAFDVTPIANSQTTLESLGRAGRGAEKIDLGVDPTAFHPTSGRARWPIPLEIPAGAPTMLVMARMTPRKGQLLLIQALEETPDLHLMVCGGPLEGDYAQAVQAAAQEPPVRGRVHVVGPTQAPMDWYAAADVVASMRTDPEPFGLSIVEAMMMERPVLVHASGGPRDIVVDGVTGWHVHEPTVGAFADGLRRVMADQARWPEMATAGRARAMERYTTDAMAASFADVLQRNLAARTNG